MDDFDTPVSTPKVILYRDSKEDKAKQILMENLALERLLKKLRKVVEHNKDAVISNFIYDVERFIQNRKERIICDFGLDKAAELYRNVRESYREKNLYPSDLFASLEDEYYKYARLAAVYLLNNENIIINGENITMYLNYLRQVTCLYFAINNSQLDESLKKEMEQLKLEITYRLYLLANYLGYKKEDRDRFDAKYFDSYQNGEFDFHEAFANSEYCERAEELYEKIEQSMSLSHEDSEDSYESLYADVEGLSSKFERNIDGELHKKQSTSDDKKVSRSIEQLVVTIWMAKKIYNLYGEEDALYKNLCELYASIINSLYELTDYKIEEECKKTTEKIGEITSKYAWSLSEGEETLYAKCLEAYENRIKKRMEAYIARQPKSQTDTSQSTPKRVEVFARRRVSEPISTSNSEKETDRPVYQSRRLQLFQERVNLAEKQLETLKFTKKYLESKIERAESDISSFSKKILSDLESRLADIKAQIETLERRIQEYKEKYGISPVKESARKFRHR